MDYRFDSSGYGEPVIEEQNHDDDMTLHDIRQCRTIPFMRTVIETEVFQRYAASLWDDGEREQFIAWIAANPLAGDVIPGTGGLRKVRWSRAGMGKRGGARVIYYNANSEEAI